MLRRRPTRDDLVMLFDHYLARALSGQEMPTDTGLRPDVLDALNVVARAAPNVNSALIAVAKAKFEAQCKNLEIGSPGTGAAST